MGMSRAQQRAQAAAKLHTQAAAVAAPVAPGAIPPIDQSQGQHGALSEDEQDELAGTFEESGAGMHKGLHDGVESELHFGGEIHSDDAPRIWQPPAQMAAPEPRPGMRQRWVRMSLVGKPDPQNQAMQGGNGWRPRGLSTVPADERGRYPTTRDARSGGTFMVNGDAILCEMPEAIFKQMQGHYRQAARSQVDALGEGVLENARVKGAERHGFRAPAIVEDTREQVHMRRPVAAAD
jgi:hypothetical protein